MGKFVNALGIRSLIRAALTWFNVYRWKKFLKASASRMEKKRIIVGAAGTSYSGWLQTDKNLLNLLRKNDWARLFRKGSLDAILAEHVWEHLTPEEATLAASNCFEYLKQGACLRIAVPDGYHPDAKYIDQVRPGGSGPGADDHKVLYNYHSLSKLLEGAGYEVRLQEWFDEQGKFHHENWSREDGFVLRSTRYDPRNRTNPVAYTSLIADAIKT